MTSETHKEGGMLVSMIGFLLLKRHNLLLPDVNEALQLLVIYPFAMWGSTASDLDHRWESAPSKDGFSWLINHALHLTTKTREMLQNLHSGRKNIGYRLLGLLDARHRSWQTHSDLTILTIGLLLWALMRGWLQIGFTAVDTAITALILTGIGLGMIAHFILDMLTPQGVRLVSCTAVNRLIGLACRRDIRILPEHLHIVPHWHMFSTGSHWEHLVCIILRAAKAVLIVFLVVMMLIDAGVRIPFLT